MSGIVRKIDDLGRIVIPKEIRKSLNIKNSDDIEIKLDENKVVLEKYYRLKSLKEILNDYCNILDRFLSSGYIITDKENIIITSKEFINLKGERISNKIIELLDCRKSKLDNNYIPIKLTTKFEISKNYYFYPIIIDTDIFGSIVLLNNKKIDASDLLVVDIFNHLLKEKIE